MSGFTASVRPTLMYFGMPSGSRVTLGYLALESETVAV